MRIASKLNAAFVGAFACGTFAAFAVLQTTIKPRFDQIERDGALLNHNRVKDALDVATEKLQTATQDYAFWDETYSFLQGIRTDTFIKSNLEPEFKAVENLGVNALVFIDKAGIVRWGAAYDLQNQEKLVGAVEEFAAFSKAHPDVKGQPPFANRGLVRTSHGLMLVAISPALKSDHSGEPMGRVISAKKLDIEAIKSLTGVKFSIEDLASGQTHPTVDVILTSFDEEIVTSSLINDVVDHPLVELEVSSPRDVSRAGAVAIRSALLMMVLAVLAANAVLWMFLRSAVVSRISALKNHFAVAGTSGMIRQTSLTGKNDEISELAVSFNAMAEQVNHLRDALADSAYMSGLSEWATGTLHNVRNGMAPITATTWQVEKLYSGAWLDNVAAAAKEYSDATASPDRRGKLNAYLVGSAAKLLQAARDTMALTTQLNAASRNVVDMVGEFEQYANRKIELEAIDLLPLIKSTVSSTTTFAEHNIDVVLPSKSVTVTANSVILRQILANVIINASEALNGVDRRGRIEISAQTEADGSVLLAVADNGEGISPEKLSTIFTKGFSTRSARMGGLGLHWCANATKVLGGSISARSDGPNCGAVITISLPNAANAARKAA